MHERKAWSKEQDDLIRKCAQNITCLKWNKILKQIKIVNPDFARTSKQIRERWISHLDPHLSNQTLTPQEQEIIFKSHATLGSKWKEIQKLLPTKSQKSIKNFFYSTLRKSIRRVTKIFGAKNSTIQSRQMKPHVLNKLIESANEHPEKRQSIYHLFKLHKIKNCDCKALDIPEKDIQIYREIVDDITYFNQLYTFNKKQGYKALQKKLTNSKCQSGALDNVLQKQTIHGPSTVGDTQHLDSLQISEVMESEDQFFQQPKPVPLILEQNQLNSINYEQQEQNSDFKLFQT